MVIINLREFYPFYCEDCIVEVSDDVAQVMQELDHQELSYRRKLYRHKAFFSLEQDDGIEHGTAFTSMSPEEFYECKVTREQLHAAMAVLSEKQAKRIYAHYFLGMSQTTIAHAECVSCNVISASIKRGLKKMKKNLQNSLR